MDVPGELVMIYSRLTVSAISGGPRTVNPAPARRRSRPVPVNPGTLRIIHTRRLTWGQSRWRWARSTSAYVHVCISSPSRRFARIFHQATTL